MKTLVDIINDVQGAVVAPEVELDAVRALIREAYWIGVREAVCEPDVAVEACQNFDG